MYNKHSDSDTLDSSHSSVHHYRLARSWYMGIYRGTLVTYYHIDDWTFLSYTQLVAMVSKHCSYRPGNSWNYNYSHPSTTRDGPGMGFTHMLIMVSCWMLLNVSCGSSL